MVARRTIHTMTALLCHLVLGVVSLTIQLRAQVQPNPQRSPTAPTLSGSVAAPVQATAQSSTSAAQGKKNPRPRGNAGEPITFSADQEEKRGDLYLLRGNAEIDFRKYKLQADEITYDDHTGIATATGHVVLDGGAFDEHMSASHGTYNVNSDTGRFWDVVGTIGAKSRGRSVVLTSSNPFFFRGAVVDKAGPEKFVVHHGVVTSCKLPRPKWSLHAQHVTVVPGQDAKLVHSTFWLWRLPIFYFPFFDHSVERKTPKTGFLMPLVGLSNIKGTIFSGGFFWSITPSINATLGADYYSKRGWAQRADFRAWYNDRTYLLVRYFGVLDKGVVVKGTTTRVDQGGEEMRINGQSLFGQNGRAVVDVDYLSSYAFRAVFGQSFYEPITSEVRSIGFVTDTWKGYSLGLMTSRYQSFQSFTPGDVIRISHTPSLEVTTADRQVADSPVYWGFDAATDGVSRGEPGFVTSPVARLDMSPHISLPLFWRGWTLRPDLAVRDTWYSDSFVPGGDFGQPAGPSVNRYALDAQVELRAPTVDRIFDSQWLGESFKHTIEPRVIYRNVSGINNFSSILRFDARDVLSNTNEVEYALSQRLYVKRLPPKNCVSPPSLKTSAADNTKAPEPRTDVTGSHSESANPETSAAATQKDGGQGQGPHSAATAPNPPADTPAAPSAEANAPAQAIAPAKQPKATQPQPSNCPTAASPPATQFLTWEVAQKYFLDPNFGGALVPGRPNVFTTTVEFAGIAFLFQPRRFSPVISRLMFHKANMDLGWYLDYDIQAGRISSSLAGLTYRFPHQLTFIGSHSFLQTPVEVFTNTAQGITAPSRFNQLALSLYYGHPNRKGFSLMGGSGYDIQRAITQSVGVKASYNWDCCGITAEFGRSIFTASGRPENGFRFSFSLANVGTFGTIPRVQRVY